MDGKATDSWIKLGSHGWCHARVRPWMANCNVRFVLIIRLLFLDERSGMNFHMKWLSSELLSKLYIYISTDTTKPDVHFAGIPKLRRHRALVP